MTELVESIGVEFGVIDAATSRMENIGRATDNLAYKTARLQSAMNKKIEITSANLMTRALAEMTGGIKGADMAFMLLGRQIHLFMAKAGWIGLALAATTAAFMILRNVLIGMADKYKESANEADALADKVLGVARGQEKMTETAKEYLIITKRLLQLELDKLRAQEFELSKKQEVKDYMMLRSRGNLEHISQLLLENKYVKDYIELLSKRVSAEKKLANIQDIIAEKKDLSGKDISSKIREIEISFDKKLQQEKLNNYRAYWEEQRKIDREYYLIGASEEERNLAESLDKYKSYLDAINKADLSEAEARIANEMYVYLVKRDLWLKSTEFQRNMILATFEYMAALSEKWAYGEKITTESVTANYALLWLEAIEQVVRAKMIAALIESPWLAALYGGALVAIGGIKGALKQWSDKSLGTYPQSPTFTSDFGSQYGGGPNVIIGGSAVREKTMGGISSSHSQVINYFTISPKYDMLDVSLLTEQRLKEIAITIGRYIQEGVATGQLGLS